MGEVFRKHRPDAPPGFFRCEAAGLAWLRAAGAVPVVEVLDVGDEYLDLRWVRPGPATPEAAAEFGRGLALLHGAGAPHFGATPPGWTGDGFFGPLADPLVMRAGEYSRWGEFLADCRIAPMAAEARVRRALSDDDARLLERVCARLAAGEFDDDGAPARLHGDLWAANVLWTDEGATLIDPAAHGGHRETDLAMLALFGAPHLDRMLDAYREVHPLAEGWRERVGLHQLYPVGVHAVLFGGGYAGQLRTLARPYA